MSLQIDSTDRRILTYLARDARIKVVEIAALLGMTGAAVHQRLSKIKKLGLIKDFTINVDEKKLGYTTCSFIGIYLDKSSQSSDVVERLKSVKEVVEAHYTTGEYSLFIKVFTKDNDHLRQVLNKQIQIIRGVSRTETFISLEEPIQRSVPID